VLAYGETYTFVPINSRWAITESKVDAAVLAAGPVKELADKVFGNRTVILLFLLELYRLTSNN